MMSKTSVQQAAASGNGQIVCNAITDAELDGLFDIPTVGVDFMDLGDIANPAGAEPLTPEQLAQIAQYQ